MKLKKMLSFVLPCVYASSLCSAQVALRPTVTSLVVPSSSPMSQTSLVQLTGHLAPILSSAQDLGRVSPSLPFEHVLLQFKRTPAQQAALDQTIADLHTQSHRTFTSG